jgi:hypothetical protein
LTSKNLHKIYPFEAFLSKGTGNLPKNSKVKTDQIRTLDKSRLVKFMGELDGKEMKVIETAIKIHLGFGTRLCSCLMDLNHSGQLRNRLTNPAGKTN